MTRVVPGSRRAARGVRRVSRERRRHPAGGVYSVAKIAHQHYPPTCAPRSGPVGFRGSAAVATLASVARRCVGMLIPAGLEAGRDGLRLGPSATRPPPPAALAVIRRLAAAIRAVGGQSLPLFLMLLTPRRLASCFGNRVGNRARDEFDGTNRIVVAGDRNSDEVGVR